MKSYIFNPEYVVCENNSTSIVFTSNMEYIYVFKEVESIILKVFFHATIIDEAVEKISSVFSDGSFMPQECLNFINVLITEGILIDAKD